MALMSSDVEVSNKQVLLKEHLISGNPKESNMYVTTSKIKLKLPQGSTGVLVKNLYFQEVLIFTLRVFGERCWMQCYST
ncbi:hypothetical protein CerSpe_266490 [Prunus speciosa]